MGVNKLTLANNQKGVIFGLGEGNNTGIGEKASFPNSIST